MLPRLTDNWHCSHKTWNREEKVPVSSLRLDRILGCIVRVVFI